MRVSVGLLVLLVACSGDPASGPSRTPTPTVEVHVTTDAPGLCPIRWHAQIQPFGTEANYQIFERLNDRWQGASQTGRFHDSVSVTWDHADGTAWPYMQATSPAAILVHWVVSTADYSVALHVGDTLVSC